MALPSPTNQVVVFNYADWASLYPELSTSVQAGQAQGYFNQATLYLDNTPTTPVVDAAGNVDLFSLTTLLYTLTAHVAKLFTVLNGQAPSGLVGQITSASEGSVSVGTVQITPSSDLQAWLNQTSYGAMYWAASLKYRTAFYRPPALKRFGAFRRWPC